MNIVEADHNQIEETSLKARQSEKAIREHAEILAEGLRKLIEGEDYVSGWKSIRTKTNVGEYNYLTYQAKKYGEKYGLEPMDWAQSGGQYVHRDFNHWIGKPSVNDVENFLRDYKAIETEILAELNRRIAERAELLKVKASV